jgi:site-specific DNA-adenine methylase
LRPFFPYYGSKWNIARHYPAPLPGLVIEPFAGGAGYATFYDCKRVHLIDADPIIAGLWAYLIATPSAEIMALPEMPGVGDCVDNYAIPRTTERDEMTSELAALAEIERLANEHRDDWIEARHTDDGDRYRIAMKEALKWEAIGAIARTFLSAT